MIPSIYQALIAASTLVSGGQEAPPPPPPPPVVVEWQSEPQVSPEGPAVAVDVIVDDPNDGLVYDPPSGAYVDGVYVEADPDAPVDVLCDGGFGPFITNSSSLNADDLATALAEGRCVALG